ncbi:DUF5309 family protein [Bradyrhizobium sp. KB893862 SZCCT0404]|uniref:SU10 major capsid protein n=1 Tax=Bradyrhizobium sp. KB893862 SZCCT0404 TaxID=2807672 RepID=UPI001BAA7564|nr:DUF5309 family protein [Bradyrhizobium sp. KB893862 SZCCT0404]MBR1173898.1 DUF5309 family protein [Bradyrhizobium sp. KB893862 SZCCT0404]
MGTQYQSYDVVGAKEDVSDIISMITPTKAPFTSLTKQETVHNTYFEWQEDELRDSAENAQVEGFTATPTARTPTVMRGNVTQIMQDTFEVSGTNDAVAKYGRGKESAREAGKAAAALKLDLEDAFTKNDVAMVKPVTSGTARKFAGVQRQIDAGNIVYTGATGTKISEENYLDAAQALYDAGADASITLVTPTNSRTFAGFTGAAGRSRVINDDSKKIVNAVNLYVSPFGEEKIVLSRRLKAGDTLLFDPANWKRVVLNGRNWFRETLAKTGDSMRMMIVGEFSLKHVNQKASALVREMVDPG